MNIRLDHFREPLSASVTPPPTPPSLMRKRSTRMWAVEVDGERLPSRSPSLRSESSFMSVSSSPSCRRSSAFQSDLVSNAQARRASVWDEIMSSGAPNSPTLTPLAAIRRAMNEVALNEGVEERQPSLESFGLENELALKEKHLIDQSLDFRASLEAVSGMATLKGWTASTLDDEESLQGWEISNRVAYKWCWFVLASVHLRFADCAEQQEDTFHAEGLATMTNLRLKPDLVSRNDKPTRRATLFGNVIGTYRASIYEGVIRLTHCLGDDVSDISQALRVRVSNMKHRVQKKPQLFYDHIRPKQPRCLPPPRDALEEDSLLSALQLHESKREKEKEGALYNRRKKDVESITKSKDGGMSPLSPCSLDFVDKERASSLHRLTVGDSAQRRRKTAQFMRSEFGLVAHVAHMEALQEDLKRIRLFQKKSRVHETMEFFVPRLTDLWDILRQHYDPELLAHVTNQHYYPLNLLKRDALRFDPRIQFLLHTIYQATDVDKSGGVDRDEYDEMHSKLTCALLGREVSGDSTVRYYMSNLDWQSDSKGFKSLNRQRLEDCFFTMADRFTSGTETQEYVAFLNRLLTRIVKFDPETGEVGLRSEEDIWALGDTDPLVENNEFRLQSKRQREAKAQMAQKAVKAVIVDRIDSRAHSAAPPETSSLKLSIQKAQLQSESSLSFTVLSRLLRDEGFNESMLPKYTIVFDWEAEDNTQQLAVEKEDIVYACPPSLDIALGPPPDADGWTLAFKLCSGQDKFGWCPDAVMLYLSRQKEPQPTYTISGKLLHNEEIITNVKHSDLEKLEEDEPLNDDDLVHEELVKRGLDVKGGEKKRKERLQHVKSTEFETGEQVKHKGLGLRAVVRAVQFSAVKMKKTCDTEISFMDEQRPLTESLAQAIEFGSPDLGTRAHAPPSMEPQPPQNVDLRTKSIRQTRVRGGNLRFPGFSSEPIQRLSEHSSGPHLTSNERARFSQSLESEKFFSMAGGLIPPAKPTPDMVAEAARRYMDRFNEVPRFLHHGFSNTAVRAPASHSSHGRSSVVSILSIGSAGDGLPVRSPPGGAQRWRLQSAGAGVTKKTTGKLPELTKPRVYAETPGFRSAVSMPRVAAVPLELVQPVFSSRPSTGLRSSATKSVVLPPYMRGRGAFGFRFSARSEAASGGAP